MGAAMLPDAADVAASLRYATATLVKNPRNSTDAAAAEPADGTRTDRDESGGEPADPDSVDRPALELVGSD